jgi:hypothetical protein
MFRVYWRSFAVFRREREWASHARPKARCPLSPAPLPQGERGTQQPCRAPTEIPVMGRGEATKPSRMAGIAIDCFATLAMTDVL